MVDLNRTVRPERFSNTAGLRADFYLITFVRIAFVYGESLPPLTSSETVRAGRTRSDRAQRFISTRSIELSGCAGTYPMLNVFYRTGEYFLPGVTRIVTRTDLRIANASCVVYVRVRSPGTMRAR